MKKVVLLVVLGILVFSLASLVVAENYTQITNETCDALTNCSGDLKCYNFPDLGLRCAEADPCSYYNCGENKTCNLGESYPTQIVCIANETEQNETEEKPACSEITKIKQCIARKDCRYIVAEQRCEDNPNYNQTKKIHKLKETLQEYLNSSECPENCVCAGSTIKCETENGRVMTVVAGKSGNIIIQTKNINASTTVILIKNETGIFGNFSKKGIKRVKFLPDEIKEKVLKKLKMKDCNCSIELRDDGAYEMRINRQYRILGILPRKIVEVTKIDSENGEIIVIKRPWWKFLAFKSKE